MKMKNVLMILISLAVVFAMAGAVGAEGTTIKITESTNPPQAADIQVTYRMNENYTVTIPSSIPLDIADGKWNATGSAQISADNVRIQAGKYLNVTISGGDYSNDGNKWVLKEYDERGNVLPLGGKLIYQITIDQESVVNNGIVLSVPAGKGWFEGDFSPIINTLDFETEEVTISGEFKDVLTFTVEVTPSSQ